MFIDDIRYPESCGFDSDMPIMRTSRDAIRYLEREGCPTFISFDHDLGGSDTTIPVVNFIIEMDLNSPGFIPKHFRFNVHSANPVGSENIRGKLCNYLHYRKCS